MISRYKVTLTIETDSADHARDVIRQMIPAYDELTDARHRVFKYRLLGWEATKDDQ